MRLLLLRIQWSGLVVALGVAGCLSSATAEQNSKFDQDIEVLADFLAPFTHTLKRPAYGYNWQHMDPSLLRRDAADPTSFAMIKAGGGSYWADQTSVSNRGGVGSFGTGLYLAVDPVVSRDFGGYDGNWVLNQVRMPTGFRILDVKTTDTQTEIPAEVAKAWTHLGCPAFTSSGSGAWLAFRNNLMTPAGGALSPQCANAIQTIVRKKLAADAFSYPYSATYFPECDTSVHPNPPYYAVNSPNTTAFVVLEAGKLKPEDVRSFNRLTNHDEADRLRIESFFYKAGTLTPYPTQMHMSGPPGTSDNPDAAAQPTGLLWEDLSGMTTDPTLMDWMKANLFTCGSPPPY